ncbi:MAG: prepilin-type N-terminal cleavage/methylation domain-containing protein [Phycisphaerales bacterium]|nr:prepilin-type N-terminal cleavage/methylation domain-containing protein [Phycisphaerales bacterium]
MRHNNHAISFVELLVVIAIIAILIGILLPSLNSARAQSRQLKDATSTRTIAQALSFFAHNNRGQYPLPGSIYKPVGSSNIPPQQGEHLNTSGNLLSLLIFNGSLPVEICISPVESNTDRVVRKTNYQFTPPTALPDALWDPTFRGTPTDEARTFGTVSTTATDPGNNSYAPLVVVGKRRRLWQDTTTFVTPVIGNRGPTYQETSAPASGRYRLTNDATGIFSHTLLIHGPRHSWEGNIAHNDGHVSFETRPDPSGLAYTSANPGTRNSRDNLFINETDELGGDTTPTSLSRGQNILLRPISRVTGANPNYTYTIWVD